MRQAIFEIYDRGKVYKIYKDGRIKGFSKDAFIVNRIPVKILTVRSCHLNRLKSTGRPASNSMSSFLGCSQGTPEYEETSIRANCKETGEK